MSIAVPPQVHLASPFEEHSTTIKRRTSKMAVIAFGSGERPERWARTRPILAELASGTQERTLAVNLYKGMKNARTSAKDDSGPRRGNEFDRVLWIIAAVITGAIVWLVYTL